VTFRLMRLFMLPLYKRRGVIGSVKLKFAHVEITTFSRSLKEVVM